MNIALDVSQCRHLLADITELVVSVQLSNDIALVKKNGA